MYAVAVLFYPQPLNINNIALCFFDCNDFLCSFAGTGLQIFHDDGSSDLFALYSGDLSERMLSYASGTDLCKIEALNSQFRPLGPPLLFTLTLTKIKAFFCAIFARE